MHIVVVGGSFGGLTAAYDLRRLLRRREHQVTVISKERRFIFIPSLPWVAMGSKTIADISFDLEAPLIAKGIDFVEATITGINPRARKVLTVGTEYEYDILLLATGHRSANEAVPGLGPFDGPGHSLTNLYMGLADDIRARTNGELDITVIDTKGVDDVAGGASAGNASASASPAAGERLFGQRFRSTAPPAL